jgi:hypothetical protein
MYLSQSSQGILLNPGDTPTLPAEAWGYDTSAITGGRFVDNIEYVTNLNDSGAGSFYAVSRGLNGHTGQGHVVFEIGGVQDRDDQGNVTRTDVANRTYHGNTAPGGFNIHGRSARIGTGQDNVIWRHIRIRMTDSLPEDPLFQNRDCAFTDSASNILYDHCSFAYSSDEIWSAYLEGTGGDNILAYRCIMGPPLGHDLGARGGSLVGQSRLAMVQCMQWTVEGRPLIEPMGTDGNAFINNWFWGWIGGLLRFDDRATTDNADAYVRFQNNIFTPSEGGESQCIIIDAGVNPSATAMIDGNWTNGATLVDNRPPLTIDDDTGTKLENQDVNIISTERALKDALVADCGANPSNRDEVDEQVITDIQTSTSSYSDSPAYTGIAISLKVPDSPSDYVGMPTVSGADTHTNLYGESLQARIESQSWWATKRNDVKSEANGRTFLEDYLYKFKAGVPPPDE